MSNVQIVRDTYHCLDRGDIAALLGLMDADIEWSLAEGHPYQPSGQAWIGFDAVVKNLLVNLLTDYDGTFAAHPEHFYDAGETVVVEVRYTGTFKATGKALDAQVCHIFKVRDGKVTSFQQFADTAQLQHVMEAR